MPDTPPISLQVHGVLLAAGAGQRMGVPKALVADADGTPWLQRATSALINGGCDGVTVVLGARATESAAWVPREADVVIAEEWERGMSASLSTGLNALTEREFEAALIHLVDLPDVTSAVVERVLRSATSSAALARASYRGDIGHPVLIGADHWDDVIASLDGDSGARTFLREAAVTAIECGDLASGLDVDAGDITPRTTLDGRQTSLIDLSHGRPPP